MLRNPLRCPCRHAHPAPAAARDATPVAVLRSRRHAITRAGLLVAAALGASLPGVGLATGEGGAERPAVLVLGDSLSAEYGLRRGTGWVGMLATRAAAHRPPWRVVNASISGETTSGGRSRIDALLRQHKPQIVIIELGGNDALRGLDLSATEANVVAMTRAAKGAGARVLLLGMQVPPNYGRAYSETFAALFSRVAQREGAALVPFFLEPIAERPDMFQPDRIHPTEAAQQALFEIVWAVLEPMLERVDAG